MRRGPVRTPASSSPTVFDVSCRLEYAVSFPSTLILNVHAQRNASQTVMDEHFAVEPRVQ